MPRSIIRAIRSASGDHHSKARSAENEQARRAFDIPLIVVGKALALLAFFWRATSWRHTW